MMLFTIIMLFIMLFIYYVIIIIMLFIIKIRVQICKRFKIGLQDKPLSGKK